MNDAYPFDRKLNYDKLQLLIGTSANSIEFWPGPNDLSRWGWLQYAKYVSTSLDSFNSSISQLALQQYPPRGDLKNFKLNNNPLSGKRVQNSFDLIDQLSLEQQQQSKTKLDQPNQLNDINQLNSDLNTKKSKLSPESLYTRMVSDIKQTCPINIVAENLARFHNSTVFRYIATSGPSHSVSSMARCIIYNV